MKILIESSSGKKLSILVPTSLLKRKFVLKIISKKTELEDKYIELLPKVIKELKKYIKVNGHFTLVDIRSSDGNRVIIKV